MSKGMLQIGVNKSNTNQTICINSLCMVLVVLYLFWFSVPCKSHRDGENRSCMRGFFWVCIYGLRPSVGHSVCRSVGLAPPVYPVAFRASSSCGHLGFMALRSGWHDVIYSKRTRPKDESRGVGPLGPALKSLHPESLQLASARIGCVHF